MKIVLSEIVEAIFFFFSLLIASSLLPEDNIKKELVTIIIILWVVSGIATPLIIWTELEKEVLSLFRCFSR